MKEHDDRAVTKETSDEREDDKEDCDDVMDEHLPEVLPLVVQKLREEEGGVERELDEVVPSERGSEGLFSDVANDPLVTVVEPLCR